MDKSIKIWNMLGECKYTDSSHTDAVSCIKLSEIESAPRLCFTASYNKTIKVWSAQMAVKHEFTDNH